MIEGLVFRLEKTELQAHLQKRVKYHNDKADMKEKELPALREALKKIKDVEELQDQARSGLSADSVNWLNDTVGGAMVSPDCFSRIDGKEILNRLYRDIKTHRRAALNFQFFQSHLFDDVYMLTVSDLNQIEFLN